MIVPDLEVTLAAASPFYHLGDGAWQPVRVLSCISISSLVSQQSQL